MVLHIGVFHNAVKCDGSFVISHTEQELDSREREKIFLLATVKRSAMGPNQFSIQYSGRKRLGREFNQSQAYRSSEEVDITRRYTYPLPYVSMM